MPECSEHLTEFPPEHKVEDYGDDVSKAETPRVPTHVEVLF